MLCKLRLYLMISLISLLTACAGSSSKGKPVQNAQKAAEINTSLGLNYMQNGNYEIAMSKLQKAVEQNPKSAEAHNAIALLYQILGEDNDANKHYKKAVSLAPQYSEAQNNYGVFLCQQGDYKEAEQRFLLAVENPLYASTAQAYENAGLCAMSVPNLAKAEGYFKQALEIYPQLVTSTLELAKINYQQADYVRARSYIQRYQLITSWTPETLLLAIQIENKLQNNDAVASYTLLLRARFPTSDEALQVQTGQY